MEELVLRVNRTQTALVLGGSSSSAIPPDILIPGPKVFVPVQLNIVKALASILAPPLCPSTLSSKYRISVLLHDLNGSYLSLGTQILFCYIHFEFANIWRDAETKVTERKSFTTEW